VCADTVDKPVTAPHILDFGPRCGPTVRSNPVTKQVCQRGEFSFVESDHFESGCLCAVGGVVLSSHPPTHLGPSSLMFYVLGSVLSGLTVRFLIR
jgi:hypothetical protein